MRVLGGLQVFENWLPFIFSHPPYLPAPPPAIPTLSLPHNGFRLAAWPAWAVPLDPWEPGTGRAHHSALSCPQLRLLLLAPSITFNFI